MGTLCGQVVPGNMLTRSDLRQARQGSDAKGEANRPQTRLAPTKRAASATIILPQAFGGGFDLAVADFRKAIELSPRNADAYLWLGLSLRKQNKDAEARQAFAKVAGARPQSRLGQTAVG